MNQIQQEKDWTILIYASGNNELEPEMVRAINKAANDIGKIDALVLDTCYFNSIEVIYELGSEENHSLRSALQNTSFQGIVASKPTTDNLELISRYYRLGFAQGNCWTRLLSNKHVDVNMAVKQQKGLLPLKTTSWAVRTINRINNIMLGKIIFTLVYYIRCFLVKEGITRVHISRALI